MSRTHWLMEQIVKTELELVKCSTDEISHQFHDALYIVDGIQYKISLNIMQYDKPVQKADGLKITESDNTPCDGSFGT